MGSRLSGLCNGIYDSKRRQFLGRDGAGWAKLGIFYFFFYLGLAGFFCAMLAVFMAVTPKNVPRYCSEDSTMKTRSNPFSPGLGFRPQPVPDKNLVLVNQNEPNLKDDPYVKSLTQYLQVRYWTPSAENPVEGRPFKIDYRHPCTSQNQYDFRQGKPCVLVKMNKIVGFEPTVGYQAEDQEARVAGKLPENPRGIPVYCYGEYPADVENIGNITYYSENDVNNRFGTLNTDRFPYKGKSNRQDVYQAPYIWAHFDNPKKNVLINVICRVFANNINFDRKTARGLTRFQIFIQNNPKKFV